MLEIDRWYLQISGIWHNDPKYDSALFKGVPSEKFGQLAFWFPTIMPKNQYLQSIAFVNSSCAVCDMVKVFESLQGNKFVKSLVLDNISCDDMGGLLASVVALLRSANISHLSIVNMQISEFEAHDFIRDLGVLCCSGNRLYSLRMTACGLLSTAAQGFIYILQNQPDYLVRIDLRNNFLDENCKSVLSVSAENASVKIQL